MRTISVSAPGKLLLLGEHAAVYGHPCIVTAVNQRMHLVAECTPDAVFRLDAENLYVKRYERPMQEVGTGQVPKAVRFVESAVRRFMQAYPFSQGIRMSTKCDFSSQHGLGSSSSVTVGAIRALAELTGRTLTREELFTMAFQAVLDVQGRSSGFDVAAAVYGGTILYQKGNKPEQLDPEQLPLIVGYSGQKADTVSQVAAVREIHDRHPEIVDRLFEIVSVLVKDGATAIRTHDYRKLGAYMNLNQGILESLEVGTAKLAAMIYATRAAGAYGAKLSGAGGGDCMIALAPEDKKELISTAIAKAGGEIIAIETNVEGVRIDH